MTDPIRSPAAEPRESRAHVLVVPPTRRDGALVQQLLGQAGFPSTVCLSLIELSRAIDEQAAAVVATDDALEAGEITAVCETLRLQPQWSDVPFVVLAAGGVPSPSVSELQKVTSVTLLDRSVQMRTLLSAVQMAVRARHRQYEIRDLLDRERQARLDASRANDAKDRFLAVLSHELRTPLTPVVFAIAALQREIAAPSPNRRSLDQRLPRMFDMISRNIALETKLIDDLLDLNRLVQGKLQLQSHRVDVHASIRDTLAMVESDAREKSVAIVIALDAGQRFVVADAARIHQVLWNLVKNAIKFTPSGGRISVRTWNDGQHLTIACQDTGIGIPADALPRVFEPFEQGSADITRHYGGLGLGLAVSRSLVIAHGGSIRAYSEGVDRGATFTVTLPNATAQVGPHAAASESPRVADTRGRSLSILLVEDHEDTARTLGDALVATGHRVRIVHRVDEALRAAAADPCEILISDIGLPDGSGIDVIRQISPAPRFGAIAVSGFGMNQDLTRSREAGFDRHLTKPVDLAVLERAINELAESKPPALHRRQTRKKRIALAVRRTGSRAG